MQDYPSQDAQKKWRARAGELKAKCGLPADYKGFTTRSDIRLSGVPRGARYLDAIDTMFGSVLKSKAQHGQVPTSKEVRSGLWLDISQNVDRVGPGKQGSLCTGSIWYSFEHDMVLDGCDHLALQGHPSSLKNDPALSTTEKRFLAGESYHLPSFGTLAYAAYLNPYASWWKAPVRV
jgi:hypothetical protein